MQLLLATENPGKKKEFTALLGKVGFECLLPSEVITKPIQFPEETGTTFAENAFIKANYIHQLSTMDTLADDSGLSIVALNNFPGVKSARWLAGDGRTRCLGVLEKMRTVTDRRAFFTCVLCLITETGEEHYFEGEYKGTIATEPKGTTGFDYDYIFVPDGYTQTLAELGPDFKNQYSHRAIALKKLSDYLSQGMLN